MTLYFDHLFWEEEIIFKEKGNHVRQLRSRAIPGMIAFTYRFRLEERGIV